MEPVAKFHHGKVSVSSLGSTWEDANEEGAHPGGSAFLPRPLPPRTQTRSPLSPDIRITSTELSLSDGQGGFPGNNSIRNQALRTTSGVTKVTGCQFCLLSYEQGRGHLGLNHTCSKPQINEVMLSHWQDKICQQEMIGGRWGLCERQDKGPDG